MLDKRKKVVILTVMPSPYQLELFREMKKNENYNIRIYYYSNSSPERMWDTKISKNDGIVLSHKDWSFFNTSFFWNPEIMKVVNSWGPDLVVVSDYSALSAQYAMWALTLQRTPWIFWGEIPGFSQRGPIGSWVRRRLQDPLRFSAGVAAVGSRAAATYGKLFPGKRIYDIPYFCDLEPYRAAATARSSVLSPSCVILFSGQMIARKGVDVLIDAFIQLASSYPEVKLYLLGGGPELDRFEAMVPDGLRDRAQFIGHRQPEDLPSVFAEADIFCLPSRHDGWGVVINEALGAGLPIVATDKVGAAHDLVQNGVNGFIVPAEDHESLAAALSRLCDDAALRARCALASRTAATRWDVDEGARRWEAAIADVLGGNKNISAGCA
jgi:glycosyltransferase involved in cell wall biosynthesis